MNLKWALLLIPFLLLASWLGPTIYFQQLTNEQKLVNLIEKDLLNLKNKKQLPSTWGEISSIELNTDPHLKKPWLSSLLIPISLKANGSRHLEIQTLPWSIDNKIGATVNFYLIDKKTTDTVWEFGRTFQLGDAL